MNKAILDFDPCEALTVKEAAALLHVSRPTVEKYIKAGELPSATIGRCRRIRRLDLEAFLEYRTSYGWQGLEAGHLSNDSGARQDVLGLSQVEAEDIPF